MFQQSLHDSEPCEWAVLFDAVAGQLDNYLRGIRHRNVAFAVSPDGQYFGLFTCELIEQCVAGPRGLQDNRAHRAPQKKALRAAHDPRRQARRVCPPAIGKMARAQEDH